MDLSLQLAQKQILSQRMQQSVEILQMNTITLSEYMNELTQENPLLEWQEAPMEQPARDDKLLCKLEWLKEADEQNRSLYRVEMEDERDRKETIGRRERESLREYLLFQINILKVDEGVKHVLRFLAQSTEESGYLEQGALEAAEGKFHLKRACSTDILGLLQSLDPPGVGARSLEECLMIQLKQKNASPLAINMVEKHLEDLAKNKINRVAKQLKVSLEEAKDAFDEIRKCEPKPGQGFISEKPVEYILPDIFVEIREGQPVVSLNSSATPKLFISHAYVNILKEGAAQETKEYISNKMKQAEWAIQCISKREETLLGTANCIVARQEDFFMHPNGQLKPLRMADIAECMQVHESTVSRAVRDKYLQCSRGVFPLHAFFSKALTSEKTGTISADSIQQKLKLLIEGENKKKPLSDRELTEKLQEEGIQISRRTVAKYRESMGIAGTSGRKCYE
ncbi:RNA polymerase sigma-54 factor [Anaerotignum neopropionicum]|uniref:RNA polymerase sigma-54 factor n=1 Tax=Anaerotignum neopropionicum TaxID=36847 RepID=A0A136WHJ2_9FIRM|nr:RNA polymerase sigma-54 factor [Anaerotignum neopropionicum]